MATVFGRLLAAIGAVPTQPGGHAAREPRWPACSSSSRPSLLSGIVLLAGARHLPREMALMLAKLKAEPAGASASRSAATARGRSPRPGPDVVSSTDRRRSTTSRPWRIADDDRHRFASP